MKCPYCEKEMKVGYIPNGWQPVQWIPNGEGPSMFSFSMAKTGIPLINRFRPTGYRAEAHYCPECEIVIAPTNE